MNTPATLLRRITDNVPAIIAYIDRNERYRFVNQTMAAWSGQREDELVGRTVADVTGPDAYARIKPALSAARAGVECKIEFEIAARAGGSRILEAHCVPDVTDAGEIEGFFLLTLDVTESRAIERRLRLIADHIPAVVVYVDLEERYRFVNKKMEDWFSRPAQELIGNTVLEVNGEEAYREFHWTTERAFAGESSTVEFDAELPNVGLRHFRSDIIPQFDQSANVEGYYVLTLDVTEQQKAANDLLQAKEEAEAANQAKSQFLANMSHEIRTPLNGILGMTGLLSNTELDERQSRHVEIVRGSGQLLLTVINDILDFSKIEAGKLFLEKVDFEVRHLVEATTALYTANAETKSLSITTYIDPGIPNIVTGDPNRLRQVLGNLINNAVKYTDAGTINILVTSRSTPPNRVSLAFEVADTGIGIEPAIQERLFGAFEQADGSTSRRFGGTGLGLSIARQLVELMGGTITVQSEPGQGSTFSFEVEFAVSAATSSAGLAIADAKTAHSEWTHATDAHVLLAEDNPVNQEVARASLLELGCKVVCVTNGAEAVDLHAQFDFDLIFMDCQMPEMDGYRATTLIRLAERQANATRKVPIIALTAHALDEDRQRCLEAGMDDYLPKPFDKASLDAVLRRWLPEAETASSSAAH